MNMIKKVLLSIAAVICSLAIHAQESGWGGVKGTVVNRAGREPIADAELVVSQKGEKTASAVSGADGTFLTACMT